MQLVQLRFGLLAVPMIGALFALQAVPPLAMADGWDAANAPSDLFMQSVVTRDAELGWRQLCPAVQAQLPLAPFVQYVQALRAADDAQGLAISVKFVSAVHRADGGEVRTYAAKARLSDGRTLAKTFTITTQESGCVESVG